ncbi:MAG: hypothetical protein JO037_02715 [Actinobacteria bacterium]|nr:hypothetical protein [Actinomycetota bacterium]
MHAGIGFRPYVASASLAPHFEPTQMTEFCVTVSMPNAIYRFQATFRIEVDPQTREAPACPLAGLSVPED